MENFPVYWKTGLDDIDTAVKTLKRGKLVKQTLSAGGRDIFFLMYGEKNDLKRTANLSSALGAKNRNCYADKTSPDYRPTLLLTGGVHGGEFEGIAALLNLISIFETGVDLKGVRNDFLFNAPDKYNILIIPCANPDGRARVSFIDTMVGRTFEELRYYNQGTWKNGELCGYPECKGVHPIKEHCEVLGAYFNDDGVNMMHEDFFGKVSNETRFLFDITDEYCPDLTVLLHGGTNIQTLILKPAYVPDAVKEHILELEEAIKAQSDSEGLTYRVTPCDCGENKPTPYSFNLISALYHICGEPCVTYESNQGLTECDLPGFTHEEIYRAHMILFEQSIKFIDRSED